MNITIATEQDARTISENNIKMAKETEHVTLDSHIAYDAAVNLITDPTKGFYLVAKQYGNIIGQLMITYEWSDWRNTMIWWIQSVYILKSHRKQGIYTKLYSQVRTLAKKKDISLIRLYVHNKNHLAMKTYQALGMKQTSYIMYEVKP